MHTYTFFNENLTPEDDITEKIWGQSLQTLSTQDSNYVIGFSKLRWEDWEPGSNFQVAIIAIFDNF